MNQHSEKFSKYYLAVQYLEELNNIYSTYQKSNLTAHPHPEFYLERMQDFLDLIGNPERDFKYIHITGTAGKGSVSSMVQSTLFTNGKKAGLFTSPFVTSTIEKIQVDDKYIDPLVFADIVELLKPYIEASTNSRHKVPSYFEIIFAIALIYFKKENCEYVVLEVGLGGRYDATNIIKSPLITAITNISLDHTNILGSTTDKIAKDKAGIIKKGSHFFTTEDSKEILSIFNNECSKKEAEYNQIEVAGLNYDERNKKLAGSICFDIGIIKNIEDISIPKSFPARFEIVEKNPLVIIDGAHNISKIQSTVYNLSKIKYNKLSAVISISADKDWKKILEVILPKVDILYITRFSTPGRASVDPRNILNFALEFKNGFSNKYIIDSNLFLFNYPVEAFIKAKENLNTNEVLLITGSFYLAGDIRKLYCSEEKILEQRNSNI